MSTYFELPSPCQQLSNVFKPPSSPILLTQLMNDPLVAWTTTATTLYNSNAYRL